MFEMQLAEANHQFGGVETLFLSCQSEFSMISSTIVRDCASHGAPIDTMMPKEIVEIIYDAFGVVPRTERKD
jgi:pantetheine-phosphate adenylyltransferase